MKAIPNELFFAWVEEEIKNGRSVRFKLKGNSMFPLLRNGRDEVLLIPCTEKELQPMDVVLFRYQGKHVLHRIVHRSDSQLILQGDGSYIAKEQCCVTDVIGKVSQIVRPSGKVISVKCLEWRLQSYLWVNLGIFRRPILRILHKL